MPERPITPTIGEARAERQRALARVDEAISRGEDPRTIFRAEDLDWLFPDHADLDQLIGEAARIRDEKRARESAVRDRQRFQQTVKLVREEREATQRAKLRELDEAEARHRLGLDAA